MRKPLLIILAGTLLTSACATKSGTASRRSSDSRAVASSSSSSSETGDAVSVAVEEASEETAAVVATPTERPIKPVMALGKGSDSIWKSQVFRDQLAQSYLAETDIEPKLLAGEIELLIELRDLRSAGEHEEAMALLEQNSGDAASPVFDCMLANMLFEQEKHDQALGFYQSAVRKFPKFRRAWRMIGQVNTVKGDFKAAIPALTKVIELGGGSGFTYGMLGVAYTSAESHIPAESAFRMATLMQPETINWKLGLAESLSKQGRFADAAALFELLIEGNPDRAELWLAQGEAFARMNQPLKAAENFEFVDRLGASTPDSLYNLGNIYANQDLNDLAVDAYVRALEIDPAGGPGRALVAAKYMSSRGAVDATDRLVEGIAATQQSQLNVDQQKDLLRLRARVAVARGGGEAEANILKEIVELDPLDGDALILLGQHAQRSGQRDEAVFYFERAASLESFEADAHVRHAQLLVSEGNYAGAMPLLRRAQTAQPRENVQQFLEQVERASQKR